MILDKKQRKIFFALVLWVGLCRGGANVGGGGQELHWSPHEPPYKIEKKEREKGRRKEEEEEVNPHEAQSCIRHWTYVAPRPR